MSEQEFLRIDLEYPVRPRPRHGHGRPPDPRVAALLNRDHARQTRWLEEILRLTPWLAKIPVQPPEDSRAPCWINGWLPGLDGASLYAFIASRRPRLFLEIGSGWSTKFARRAIEDHGLATRIVSIDPHPRAEIDALCDEVIRRPFEECDLELLANLEPGDMVFADNSHRCFMNSDVTVYFTELLPRLPAGVLTGVHDIFLPDDYPPEWIPRFYSEQYMLQSLLLAGPHWLTVEFPAYHLFRHTRATVPLAALWERPGWSGIERHGNGFWLETTGAARPWEGGA